MRAVKFVLDCVGAAVALLLLSPVFAAVVVWIWLDDGRPAVLVAPDREAQAERQDQPHEAEHGRLHHPERLAVSPRLGVPGAADEVPHSDHFRANQSLRPLDFPDEPRRPVGPSGHRWFARRSGSIVDATRGRRG